jgi:dTDP-4-dehydrorhamnose reductase
VETILVVGTETVVGANLAAHYAERHDVVAHSCGAPVKIEGCRSVRAHGPETELVSASQACHVIYCGPESRSSWEPTTEAGLLKSSPTVAADWARAAAAAGATFTMISSDACFTGPWIFHEEESTHACQTKAAGRIRAAEQAVDSVCPTALIVRTNAFGWSPTGSGWIEQILQTIEQRRIVEQDPIRHSTPILATDLADIVERALNESLTGVFHVAGAERVSPMNFAQRLADHFDLPWLSIRRDEPVQERAEGFGAAECSLQTKKIRKALCVAMPMLSESLDRLSAQRFNGHRDLMVDRAQESIAA